MYGWSPVAQHEGKAAMKQMLKQHQRRGSNDQDSQQERSEACAGKSASNDLERLGRKERTGQPACESKAVIWVPLLITLRFL